MLNLMRPRWSKTMAIEPVREVARCAIPLFCLPIKFTKKALCPLSLLHYHRFHLDSLQGAELMLQLFQLVRLVPDEQ